MAEDRMTWHRWLMVGCFTLAVALLWQDHESHLLQLLPYLLLLACPLLHLLAQRHEPNY
jgi:DUF2933 family protein